MSSIKSLALLALTTGFASISNAQASGSGKTTRYWDCCKGSCAWTGKADVSNPITTCDINDNPLSSYDTASGCNGGDAYMCSDQTPWAHNDTLAFGFAAVNIAGGSESSWCCACYKLTFTSTSIAGKTLIVQATNTGGDLGSNQFDLAMPGGGVGIFNGCSNEWGAPSSGWGAQYGGISSNTCSDFPAKLKPGCNFRWDWFEGADNPTVDFEQITCPAELTAKSGCTRNGETPVAYASGSDSASAASSSPAVAQKKVESAVSSAAYTPASSESSVAASSPSSSPVASSSSVASSSAVVAPASSSAAAASSSVVAPVSSSAAASSSSIVAPVSSSAAASSSSIVAPVSSSAAASSSSLVAPASGAAAAAAATGATSGSASGPSDSNADCQVQYVYEYDL
ncbi:hypothetical protein AAFC00_002985 [Neodothiora populina]|uniref:Cellulase n=1 Tax=Neodothiora populina TaxID=2781224 RepID=A0ABR3P8W2_9PEZI